MSEEAEQVRAELAHEIGRAIEGVVFALAEIIRGLHNQGGVDRSRLADDLEKAEGFSANDPAPYKTVVIAALLEHLRAQDP